MGVLMCDVQDWVKFVGVKVDVMLIVVLWVIVEEIMCYDGWDLDCVCGILLDGGKQVVFYSGELFEDLLKFLLVVCKGDIVWLDGDYEIMSFVFV